MSIKLTKDDAVFIGFSGRGTLEALGHFYDDAFIEAVTTEAVSAAETDGRRYVAARSIFLAAAEVIRKRADLTASEEGSR